MPKGVLDRALRNPLNVSRAEWQQAKRAMADPKLVKAMFKDAWGSSDSGKSLEVALAEKGFFLAKGDRRAVVALDYQGEVYALSRWCGVKARDVKARLPEAKSLPSVQERREEIAKMMNARLRNHAAEIESAYRRLHPSIAFKKEQITERHRSDRKSQDEMHKKRWEKEVAARAARLPKGMGGLWSRITGKFSKIKAQNELEAWQSYCRDRAERGALVSRQLDERQQLQKAIRKMRESKAQEVSELRAELAAYLMKERGMAETAKIEPNKPAGPPKEQSRPRSRERDSGGPDLEM